MKKFLLFFFLIPGISFAGSMKMIGEKGNPKKVDKVIEIKMYDNYFLPSEINIKKIKQLNLLYTITVNLFMNLILPLKKCT